MPIWLLILSLLSMAFCYAVARSKSANQVYWAMMGLCFGPLAIPFVFFARPKAG